MSGCGRSGLDAAERALLSELGTGSKAPFFGHHELAEQVAQQLARELERGVGRIEKRLRLLFYLWPALTIAWLAHTVATRYGSVSAMELYPHLACLFAVPDLDPASRKRIAELFRHACARLDLPLPERGDAVDGYVVQAGVPHVQIERLAEVLARAERQVGLPDIDDDTAVVGFSEAAASLVDVGHPRLRKVLEHDSVGWYARLWVTLRERPHDAPDDEFTRRLAEAATTVAVASSPGLARPCLAWREGLLAVEVPEGQGRRWILMTSSWRQEVLGQASPVAVPLPLPWPPVIEWQVSGQLRRSDHQGRLELPAPASLAVFAANGRLVAMAAFAEAGDAARPVRLARGSYDLVGPMSFFAPDEIESGPVPGGQHLRIELGDKPLTLVRGARALTLAPVQRPELELRGTALRDLHGRAIYSDQAFGVRVRWPLPGDEPEGGNPDEAPLGPRAAHALLLEITDKELPPLPLGHGPAGEAMLDLGPHLADLKPVLRRVVLKLVRRGERRPLARAATFAWVGLQPGGVHLFIGRRPANLVAAACTHLQIADDRVALTADRSYAAARLVVDEVDGRHRRETFEFPYPGLLAVLRWLDPEGGRREQVLERDHVVALRPGDPRLIEVSSPDPAATLIIGTQRRPGVFVHRPRVGIPLAMVADACRAGADQLAVRGADGIEIPLVRFTVPCEVVRWHEGADGARDERALLLGFREPLDGLRVRARDLWHDRAVRLELAPDGLRRRDAGGITLRLEPDHSGPESRARLVAELDDWPEGLWLCEVEAKLGDDPRWQALSNMRGDTFAWLVPHRLGEILKGDLTDTLAFADRVRIFAHCHKQLQRCFAQPCWEAGIRQILGLWRRLAASLAGDERLNPSWPALLLLAFVDPPLDASESWLPLVSFWDVLPRFMSLPGRNYAYLRQLERDDTTVLALLADLVAAGSVARLLQQRDALDVGFFGCFTNLGAVARAQGEVECRGFNFMSYLDRLQSACEDGEMAAWSPAEPALSASHYLSAFEGLLRRYHVLTAGQGNAQRVPSASRLALDARRWLDREGRDLAEAAVPGLSVGDAWMALPLPIDDEADALLHTAPNALAAIALACRLEARRPGALDAFMGGLADGDRDLGKVTADVHFLTVAGRNLFAFWMLFWGVLLTTGE